MKDDSSILTEIDHMSSIGRICPQMDSWASGLVGTSMSRCCARALLRPQPIPSTGHPDTMWPSWSGSSFLP